MSSAFDRIRHLEIPGRIAFAEGQGGLPLLRVQSAHSTAEIYLQGAQVFRFQKNGDAPLLFQSARSQFAPGKALRGGVPICYPWFGSREGEPAHGFARINTWDVLETGSTPAGEVSVRFGLPASAMSPAWAGLITEFVVVIGETLTMELSATNDTVSKIFEIENCLHTYFYVGDIAHVSIAGLKDAAYFDTTPEGKGELKTDTDAALKITCETNRVYAAATSNLDIVDQNLGRRIHIAKTNSRSTVVWNPWTTQLMSDFDPAEHKNMVCVEAGNLRQNKIPLAPGGVSALRVQLGSTPLS